jgi:UPF0755 protein
MLGHRMLETAPTRSGTEPPGRTGRGRAGFAIFLIVVMVAGGLAFGATHYYSWCKGASGARTPVMFAVKEGASGSEIVDALHGLGVLRCGLVSKWLLRRDGLEDRIRAGTFDLTTNMTPDEAFAILTSPAPAVPTVRLTIPEGYRLTQIADRVQEVLGIPAKGFLEVADNGDWSLPPYLPKGKPLEGFLFPQTFQFVKGETTSGDVIQRLLAEFGSEVADLPWQNAERLGLSPYEIVIVASMIEEEAKVERDRPLIAGVIYNRLKDGMTLGIDATLLYDDPTPDGQLSQSDLEFDSPYNTRLHLGLPPTPISSPGLPSLEAALNPAKTDYLYYVLCGADGHHKFAVTLEQHDRNVQACLG